MSTISILRRAGALKRTIDTANLDQPIPDLEATPDADGKIPHSMLSHRLVATAFLQNPHGARFVEFKNGVKFDDRAANLAWISFAEWLREPSREVDWDCIVDLTPDHRAWR
jgi:hypothetical protein